MILWSLHQNTKTTKICGKQWTEDFQQMVSKKMLIASCLRYTYLYPNKVKSMLLFFKERKKPLLVGHHQRK